MSEHALPIVIGAVFLVMTVIEVLVLRALVEVALPHELLVVNGRRRRLVPGGRVVRMPFVEATESMSLEPVLVEARTRGAYSQGNIPLDVELVALVRVNPDPPAVTQAVERFLGQRADAIQQVAKETLEGHARGLIARYAPEEVHQERERFTAQLRDASEDDFAKLGLDLELLLIGRVSDQRGYLDAIGQAEIERAEDGGLG